MAEGERRDDEESRDSDEGQERDDDESRDDEQSGGESGESSGSDDGSESQGDDESRDDGDDDSEGGDESRDEGGDESRDEGDDDSQGDAEDGDSDKEDGDSGDEERAERDESDENGDEGDESEEEGDDSGDSDESRGGGSSTDQEELEREGEVEQKAERAPEEKEGEEEEEREEEEEEEEKEPPGVFKSILLVLATAVFVLLGLLILSVLIAPGYISALILGVLWLALAGWLVWRFLRPRQHLKWPILATFAVITAAVVIWIAIEMLPDTTVHEKVVTGVKQSQANSTAAIPKPARRPPPPNIVRFAGTFKGAAEGSASGNAALVSVDNGREIKLTITKLDVAPGPGLHVWLAPGNGEDLSHAIDLGGLRGNKGDMQYTVMPNTDITSLHTVVIRSRVFTTDFARAELKAQ